jgi:hypothetical protein
VCRRETCSSGVLQQKGDVLLAEEAPGGVQQPRFGKALAHLCLDLRA